MNSLKISFNQKNAIDITKEPNKTSESVIITTPVNSKSLDTCFQDLLAKRLKVFGH